MNRKESKMKQDLIKILIGVFVIVGFMLLTVTYVGCTSHNKKIFKTEGAMKYSAKAYKALEKKNIFEEIIFPYKDTLIEKDTINESVID